MLVLDMDDTLLTSENKVSDATKQALIDLQERGYRLILASGRPPFGMMKVADELKLGEYGSYIIGFNGAQVVQMDNKEVVFQQGLEVSDQAKLIEFLKEKELVVLSYEGPEVVIDSENEYSHIEAELVGLPDRVDPEFFEDRTDSLPKIMGVGDPAVVKSLEDQLDGQFGESTATTTSKPFYLECFHKTVSKGLTLTNLCKELGIKLEEVVAVGDSNNDLSMLEVAGLAVAMGNGTDKIKAASDFITDTNDEDGIVTVVEKYFSNQP